MQAGRNDPCPCGSGRKYKKCCLPRADDTARLKVLAPPGIATLVEQFNANRFDAMEQGARELLAQQPQSGPAWKMLAIALARQGRDSLPAAERAAELLPDDPDAHNNLGLTLHHAGHYGRAIGAFRRALQIRPQFADAELNLGTTLQAQGDPAAAAECCRRALAIRPEFAAAYNNLGNALRALGQLPAAVAAFRAALARDPQDALAHNNLGNALHDLDQQDEALACYARAIALRPDFTEAHCNLGILARLQGDAQRAAQACERALALDPARQPAILLHASLAADGGDFTGALADCERVLGLDPHCAEALAAIPAYRRMSTADRDWAARALALADAGLTPRREALLRFALGKYGDDLGDYPAAYAAYRRANELLRQIGPAYDPAAMERFVQRLMRVDVGDLATGAAEPLRDGAPRAALVVGMPRSGTSLAEQILASHPAVSGAGELPFWRDWWAARAADGPDPAPDELIAAGQRYRTLPGTAPTAGGAPVTVRIDKMPYNFLYLGLIARAVPGLRIIHLRRDPRDTALSIYFQDFSLSQAYATGLDSIAHYYRQYLAMMAHWRRVLPPGMLLESDYEDLVADPEGASRRMVAFLGLPWDPACLDHQRTRRAVTTASHWQVRQTIHQGSVARWRRYEAFIAPLLDLADQPPG